jgi:uncharacterized protein YeaO (DUF488 family)
MRRESNKNCKNTGVRTKSVRSRVEPGLDGLRLLVTRFHGRGLPRDRYDVWMPNLGPDEKLLRDFLEGRIDWADYTRRYRAGILESVSTDRANRTIKNHGQKFTLRLIQKLAAHQPVTLLCHCAENEPHCHRHLLQRMLQRKI